VTSHLLQFGLTLWYLLLPRRWDHCFRFAFLFVRVLLSFEFSSIQAFTLSLWIRLGDGPLFLLLTVTMSGRVWVLEVLNGGVIVFGVTTGHPRSFKAECLLLRSTRWSELELPLPQVRSLESCVLWDVMLCFHYIWLPHLRTPIYHLWVGDQVSFSFETVLGHLSLTQRFRLFQFSELLVLDCWVLYHVNVLRLHLPKVIMYIP